TKTWKAILPERPEPLETAETAGSKLFTTYLKDVTTRAYVYSLDGKLEHEIALPGPGTADGFAGRHDDASFSTVSLHLIIRRQFTSTILRQESPQSSGQ